MRKQEKNSPVDTRSLQLFLTLAQTLSQPDKQLMPQPDPGRIRSNWGWARKLGLVLARGKGGRLLQKGYEADLADPLDDLTCGGSRVHSSAHDEELLAEQGCRCLILLGIDKGPLVLNPQAKIPVLTRRALVGGARLLGLELRESAPPAGDAQGVFFRTRSNVGHDQATSILLDPVGGKQRGILTLPAARLVLPVLGDGQGALLWDDLVWVEDTPQGLAFTHLAHHGTLLARTVLPLPDEWGALVSAQTGDLLFPRLTSR